MNFLGERILFTEGYEARVLQRGIFKKCIVALAVMKNRTHLDLVHTGLSSSDAMCRKSCLKR
jgi:hypothetical protein